MARRKLRAGRRKNKVRVPFLKLKINKKTIFNIIGFLLIASSLIALLSLFGVFFGLSDARILTQLSDGLWERFGAMAFLLPFVMLLFSGHFFNAKKLKFIKLN